MITIREVASQARVSPATVSRVFSEAATVKASTRQRVLQVARQLNYQPLPAARNIRRAGNGDRALRHAIAFVYERVPGTSLDAFSQELNEAVLEALMDRGFGFRMIPVSGTGGLPLDIREGKVDGVVGRGCGPVYHAILERMPVVMLDALEPDLPAYTVLPDYATGVRDATALLLAAGRRRFHFYVGDPDHPKVVRFTQDVCRGLQDALRSHGLERGDERWLPIAGTPAAGYHCAAESLADPDSRPDAIIAPDGALLGVYRVIAEAGLRIPEDMAVVGINGLSLGQYLSPPATTVDVHLRELAVESVSRLIEMINAGRQRHLVETMPTTLVVRGSTPTLVQESSP